MNLLRSCSLHAIIFLLFMTIWPFTKPAFLSLETSVSLVVSFIFGAFSAFLILNHRSSFPLAVPLWFSKPWGETRLAEPSLLWLLPTTSFLLTIINLLLAYFFYQRLKILSSLLIWASPLVTALLFYTLLKIVVVAS